MLDKDLFLASMRSAGFEPDCKIVADGKLHRFRDWLDKPGSRNGWYVLFSDFPTAGAFGCWKRGIWEIWTPYRDGIMARLMCKERFKAVEELFSEHSEGFRAKSKILWENAPDANGNHGYLTRKNVKSHGLRYAQGALLVPMRDQSSTIHGLQRIYRDGSKRFTIGSYKIGNFHMISSGNLQIICVAEGYATAATIFEQTGYTSVVAFDAGNLMSVALSLYLANPMSRLVICADNDRHIECNPGLTKANAVAESIGCTLVVPSFSNTASLGTDFNDLFVEEGAHAVLNVFAREGL